jgi:hypothetical protein
MFFAVGGRGSSALSKIEVSLPSIGGVVTDLPSPGLSHHTPSLRRLCVPRHERTLLRSPATGIHTLVDDGTLRTAEGLCVSTRGDYYLESVGRCLSATASIRTTLAKGDQFARLDVRTCLTTSSRGAREATVTSEVLAVANGAPIWSRAFSSTVAL